MKTKDIVKFLVFLAELKASNSVDKAYVRELDGYISFLNSEIDRKDSEGVINKSTRRKVVGIITLIYNYFIEP